MCYDFLVTTSLQVTDNGVVSLGDPFYSYTPEELPLNGSMIILPFWADTDVRGTGQVLYRQTTDPSLLDRATSEIRAAFPMDEYFSVTITSMVIATWDSVGYYYRHTNKVSVSWVIVWYFTWG